MVEVLHQDYIQTAKSKGLGTMQIIWKHLLRNALLPVITYLGPLTAAVFTGSFAVEKIFGIPGLASGLCSVSPTATTQSSWGRPFFIARF